MAQDGFFSFQILADGGFAAGLIGNPDRVGFGEFIIDQYRPHPGHLEIQSVHVPDLAGSERLNWNPPGGSGFSHAVV